MHLTGYLENKPMSSLVIGTDSDRKVRLSYFKFKKKRNKTKERRIQV